MFLKNWYLKYKKRKEFVDSIYKLRINKNIQSYEELTKFYRNLENFAETNRDYLINITDNMSKSQRIELEKHFDSVIMNFIAAVKASSGNALEIAKSNKLSNESKALIIHHVESDINTAKSAIELMETIHNLLAQ